MADTKLANIKLIDTSAWIEFFRNREPLASLVEEALAEDSAAICGVVELELVAGLRDGEAQILELLSALTRLATNESDYFQAGLRLKALRSKGVTLPATDTLIHQVATRNGAELLAKDKHFIQLEQEQ